MSDLRIPIAFFFGITGILLMTVTANRAALTDAPVNLYAGMAMLLFAGVMAWLARRPS
ncbi:MAG TPA: hypothetical protein VMT15_16015 [Bryobacteraceae bacterium]|nr:hypothetical protein [Bryobacteraceae bacterium]